MEIKEYHLNLRGMSGRVVRFAILDVEEIEKLEDNAARAAGEDATETEVRRAQLKMLTAGMLLEYTDPGQEPLRVPELGKDGKPRVVDGQAVTKIEGGHADPEKLKGAKWHKADDAATMLIKWRTLFGPKETSALTLLYRDHHEVNGAEFQMIVGKAQPASTGD